MSATVGTPAEYTILVQQLNKTHPKAAFKWIIDNYSLARLWTGCGPNMFRDGIYSSCAFWGANAFNDYLNKKYNGNIPSLISPIIVGTGAAILSHPFDTLGTRMQSEPGKISAWQIIKSDFQQNGAKGLYKGLYKGFISRSIAIVSGVVVVSNTTKYVKESLAPYSKNSNDLTSENNHYKQQSSSSNRSENILFSSNSALFSAPADENDIPHSGELKSTPKHSYQPK